MFLDQFSQPLKIVNHGVRLPEFKFSDEDYDKYGIARGSSNSEILRGLARVGYKEKFDKGLIPKERAKEYGDRFSSEIDVLIRTNFVDYILAVWDIMAFARREKCAIGRGRGSAAGSLINFLIGITDVDPLKYGLFFERFISEARAATNIVDGVTYLVGTMPDVDMDFGDEDRDKVIEYVAQKYPGRYTKLSTFGTLTTKILTKELCKAVAGFSEDEANGISDTIPMVFGKVYSPEQAYKESDNYRQFADGNPLVFSLSHELWECISHSGSHPSAYLISHDLVEDFMPRQLGSDGLPVSTYDMYEAQNLAIKVDLLGVQSINLVYDVAKAVGVDLDSIDVDSWDNIYKYLQILDHPYGLFQISGHTAVRALNKIQPKGLEHLSAVLAIARPGALAFIDDYADYTRNGNIKPTHPLFTDILGKTGGVCLYQETLMTLFVTLGFSLGDANTLRDIVGKKKTDKIAEWEPKIYAKAAENGISEDAAKYVWDLALASASYSFNFSHSLAYSVLTAISVHLKFNYPQQFFLHALRGVQKKPDPFEQITLIQTELPYFGIKLLPPDLVKSKMDFSLEGPDIRYGLSAIKGVAAKALEKLQYFLDKDKSNKFQVFHAAKETGLNVAVVSALIQSGCLESLGANRPRMVMEAQIWGKLSDREREYCLNNGDKYGYDLVVALKDYLNWNDGKPFKESRLETIRKHTKPYNDIYKLNATFPRLANYVYEKAMLGYSFSQNLRNVFSTHSDLKSCDEIKNQLDKDNSATIVGEVTEIRKSTSKAGNTYMKMVVADETGTITGIMVGEKLARFSANSETPKEGDVVFLEGTKNEDGIWINRCEIQTNKIYFRVNDLKKQPAE